MRDFEILRENCIENLEILRHHEDYLSRCFYAAAVWVMSEPHEEDVEEVIVEIADATEALGALLPHSRQWTELNAEVLAYTRPARALENPDVKGEWQKRGRKSSLREVLKAVTFVLMLYKELIAIAESKPSHLEKEPTDWVGFAFGIF